MFFDRRDSVALHTVASASENLLRDLNGASNAPQVGADVLDAIHPEHKAEFIEILREPQNFFKHGSKDTCETLIFNPDVNQFTILSSLLLYEGVTKRSLVPEGTLFFGWISTRYPDMLVDGEIKRRVLAACDGIDPSNLSFWAKALRASGQDVGKAGPRDSPGWKGGNAS